MRVVIGARSSDLSRIQAYTVGKALAQQHPSLTVVYRFERSQGDKDRVTPLAEFGGKGVFTQDLSGLLDRGEVDIVVHSWKDLPVDLPENHALIATLPRGDLRDMLLLKPSALQKPATSPISILTSSPRRGYALSRFLPWALPLGPTGQQRAVEFAVVRGNVPTRISKLVNGESDGLILAKAALDRMLTAEEPEFIEMRKNLVSMLSGVQWMVLPLSACPCAPAQGALAVEALLSRVDLADLFEPLNCKETFRTVSVERQTLKKYGGGCHQKIGVAVFEHPHGRVTSIQGETDTGEVLSRWSLTGATSPGRFVSVDSVWPRPGESRVVFSREAAMMVEPREGNWYVSRSSAVPETWKPSGRSVVWTAGLATWRALAERGIWVHGSSDGLGQEVDPGLSVLLSLRGGERKWIKLTHADGGPLPEWMGGGESVGTYKLLPLKALPDLTKRSHFYWMSGSAFELMVKKYPELKTRSHACGPGSTARKIELLLGRAPEVFLSYGNWLTATTGVELDEKVDE